MNSSSLLKQNVQAGSRLLSSWYEEIKLPVATACNMMCNFCTKDSDCICNGNNPGQLSKPMTPRQAVNWTALSTSKNVRMKIIRISGPGEPLCNVQTFEVLKRLNNELPDFIYGISTNGLLLEEKVEELVNLNVRLVQVAINGFYNETILRLYSRLIKDNKIIMNSVKLSEILYNSQINGIIKCIESGLSVKLNTVFYPDINGRDILATALKCRTLGVKSMRLISGYPGGKMVRTRIPSLLEMVNMRQELLKILPDVEICSYNP